MDYLEKTPLGLLVQSGASPEELLDAVALLTEYGDFGGHDEGPVEVGENVIATALGMLPAKDVARAQWRSIWTSAAERRLIHALAKMGDPCGDDLLEAALETAQLAGLSGQYVDTAERFLEGL
jgi:hypothetical protein